MAGRTWLIASFALSLAVQLEAQNCTITWTQFNNTLIYGGTANPAMLIPACKNACQSTSGCQGIDWSPQNQLGSQCFLLFTQNNKVNATGVTHYDLNCTVQNGPPSTTGLPSITALSTGLSTTLPIIPNSNSPTPGPPGTPPPPPRGTQRDCKTTYEISPETSSIGADPVPEIRDVLTCTKACTGLHDCIGFDFSQTTGCWIHTNATTFAQKFNQTGVIQFKVNRCPEEGIEQCIPIPGIDVCSQSCFPKWARFENTAGSGGQSFASSYTNDYHGCLEACFNRPDCIGIEWTGVPGSDATCTYYNTSQQSAMTSTITLKPFVTQYRLLNRCASYCQSNWQRYDNGRLRTLNATNRTDVTNASACESACRLSVTCKYYQFTRVGPFVCTLADEYYDGSNTSAPNITSYVYRINCNDTTVLPSTPLPPTTTSSVPDPCVWIAFNKTNIYGGTAVGASSLAACQASCRNTTGCQGIDWTPANPAGQQCYQLTTQNGRNQATWDVTHYDLICNSTSGVSTGTTNTTTSTSASTTSTATNTTTSTTTRAPSSTIASNTSAVCSFVLTNNTIIYGGLGTHALSLSDCKANCQANASCKSIDWSLTNPTGQQCFLLPTQNGKSTGSNVEHYDYFCKAGCLWASFADMNVFGGTLNPANDLNGCQAACLAIINPPCVGVDFVQSASSGQRCFTFTSQGNKFPATGVTHYDLSC